MLRFASSPGDLRAMPQRTQGVCLGCPAGVCNYVASSFFGSDFECGTPTGEAVLINDERLEIRCVLIGDSLQTCEDCARFESSGRLIEDLFEKQLTAA